MAEIQKVGRKTDIEEVFFSTAMKGVRGALVRRELCCRTEDPGGRQRLGGGQRFEANYVEAGHADVKKVQSSTLARLKHV